MTLSHGVTPDESTPAYYLFRNKQRPDILCAVPEDRPLPSFLGPEWAFQQALRVAEPRPPGFNNRAAWTGVRFNGFYLFQVTAWRTKLAASTTRTAIPPSEGPRSMTAGSDSEGNGERVRQHVRERLLCLLAYNRGVLRRDFTKGPEELAESIDHFTPALEWLDERYAEAFETLPYAVYTTDAAGRITFYNEAAAALWGRRPRLESDRWCGSWRIYSLDGSLLPHDRCPMAVALRENRKVRGVTAIAERPDGTRVHFRPLPTPLHDRNDNLVGAVNVLIELGAA